MSHSDKFLTRAIRNVFVFIKYTIIHSSNIQKYILCGHDLQAQRSSPALQIRLPSIFSSAKLKAFWRLKAGCCTAQAILLLLFKISLQVQRHCQLLCTSKYTQLKGLLMPMHWGIHSSSAVVCSEEIMQKVMGAQSKSNCTFLNSCQTQSINTYTYILANNWIYSENKVVEQYVW